jgi:hypothetical protein
MFALSTRAGLEFHRRKGLMDFFERCTLLTAAALLGRLGSVADADDAVLLRTAMHRDPNAAWHTWEMRNTPPPFQVAGMCASPSLAHQHW